MSGKATQLIEEGKYLAKVEINVTDDASPWGSVVTREDVRKLDRVRIALRRGDIAAARKDAEVYELKPLAAQ